MRELLSAAFADDPALEPRDVVVLTPDPAALALYRFILGDVGQGYLRQAGFMPFSDAE